MAIPMCAAFSAGASFTPSPVIATTSPFDLSASTKRSFWSGRTRAKTLQSRTADRSALSSICSKVWPVIASSDLANPAWPAIARAVPE